MIIDHPGHTIESVLFISEYEYIKYSIKSSWDRIFAKLQTNIGILQRAQINIGTEK